MIIVVSGGWSNGSGWQQTTQNSCSPRHWGHSTMHRVPPVSGPTTTICTWRLSQTIHSLNTCTDCTHSEEGTLELKKTVVRHCLWTTVHTTTHSPQSKSKLWSVLVKNALTVHEQHHLTVHLCSPVNVHVQCIVNTPPNEVTLPLTQSMLS